MPSPEQIRELIVAEIGTDWDATNNHGVDLRRALVWPTEVAAIERTIENGMLCDQRVQVWLVLEESETTHGGYRIVMREDGTFGLASAGLPDDQDLVLIGWYGDFMTTFRSM